MAYENFGKVIGVCSGKGGVGKSTISVNLAVALGKSGSKVGLLDADIYGFSIPRMMGLSGYEPKAINESIIPAEKDGIKALSMGFFVPDSDAVIWRGPMLHKAVMQFIEGVEWGTLDYLLIDLPPGTGDVSISIASKLPQTELLIVTTPQVSATEVASRVGGLAKQTKLRIAGLIENMSYFKNAGGVKEYIFGSGGGDALANQLGVDVLGKVPLLTDLRASCDEGNAYAMTDAGMTLFSELAANVVKHLKKDEHVTSAG